MKRTTFFALFVVCGVGIAGIVMSNRADAQGGTPRSVRLQATSPGILELGNLNISGTARAGRFIGDGSMLTNIAVSNLAPGTYTGLYQFTNPGNVWFGDGSNLTGIVATNLAPGVYPGIYVFNNPANAWSGDGSNLTGVVAADLAAGAYANLYSFTNVGNTYFGNGANLTGVVASGLAGGVYPNAVIFSNPGNTFNGVFSGNFVGDGFAIFNLNAAALTGTVPDANLPANLARMLTNNSVNSASSAFQVTQNGAGLALDVNGDADVSGTLSKGGGAFKIDHPLDPANYYLYHSFVESPDMKNIYDGVAVCDSEGRAVVELPDYFQALNRDFRYQLTCIGGFSNVFIEQEVQDNMFVIAGGRPGLKVSWQVTGIRQDAFANQNRIPNEVPKAVEDRGRYLHPTAFGMPAEWRIGYEAPRE